MKLIVIGRDGQDADLVINASDYVSNYHAEILLFDNGEMSIVDKSSNGTTVNGVRLSPGKETPLHRGDSVFFADVPLDWSRIPDAGIPADAKQINNIGTDYRNNTRLGGSQASRFHATMCKRADGKWYISDHSKNGTTVNGKRIPKDRFTLLKKGDEIACAGVPVENPVKGGVLATVGICIAAACLLVAAVFGLKHIFTNYTDEQLCKKYEKAVVMMVCSYHFKVECGTLDISRLPDPDLLDHGVRRPMYDEFILVKDEDGDTSISAYDGENGYVYTATGFFVGSDGYIATNRHVARPWEGETISLDSKVVSVQTAVEDFYRAKLTKLVDKNYTEVMSYIPQIKVIGVVDNVVIVPNGEYFDEKNAFNCHEVICGEHEDEDLAIFKVRAASKPVNTQHIPLNKVKAVEPNRGMHVMTIGFPFGLRTQDIEKTKLQANNAGGDVSRNDNKYSFGFTAVSYQGASGSPVFDKKGNLIGVLNAGITASQGFNYAIRSGYLEQLIKRAEIKE